MGSNYTFEYFKDKDGKWRWRLRENNNRIVADGGEGYENKGDMLEQIDNMKGWIHRAPLIEVES